MQIAAITEIAGELLKAKEEGKCVTRPSERYADFDLQAGYLVGAAVDSMLRNRGYNPVGRKIAFTNKDTWQEFNVNTPIWAYTYDKTVKYAVNNYLELSLRRMVAPRIEPEVVVKLRNELPSDCVNPNDLLGQIEWLAMGFEIVDCHYPDWKFAASDAVADFGVHAALVIGTPLFVEAKKIATIEKQLREFKVILRKGKEIVAEGVGKNALGSPILALAHLVQLLNKQAEGDRLLAGEVITTGTLTQLPRIKSGENWYVDINGIEFPPLKIKLV